MLRHRKVPGGQLAAVGTGGQLAAVRTAGTALDELVRCAPWVVLVAIGVLGKWDPAQITAVISCLFPVLLARPPKAQA